MNSPGEFRWWRKGDLDGFFGLFIDNLIQLILIVVLCTGVLGFPGALVYGRILPGIAVSLLVGNLFYAWQARRLSLAAGHAATALPYGINTVSLFAFVLFVMQPVVNATGDADLAWRLGLAACFCSGLIELGGALAARRIRAAVPRAALLATLAGIAVTFIAMDFTFRIFADPIVGLAPLALIFMQYIGRLRMPFGLPAGLLAVLLGTLLAWSLGRMDGAALAASFAPSLHLPVPVFTDLAPAFFSTEILTYMAIIVPMGLFNLAGSLQNLESAEAAGDSYPSASSLAVNGIGSMAAACFGSCFPTTIYIGHPGWKQMGAGAGYSVANGLVITLLCLSGLVATVIALIPVEAGAAILLWIGITIVTQAFRAIPPQHTPAVVVGFFPALAAWGLAMLENGLRAAGTTVGGVGLAALAAELPIRGMIALERGYIFTSMFLAAYTVALIDRNYRTATAWCIVAALFAATGIIHGFEVTPTAILNHYGPATTWPFAGGYLAMAAISWALGRWSER